MMASRQRFCNETVLWNIQSLSNNVNSLTTLTGSWLDIFHFGRIIRCSWISKCNYKGNTSWKHFIQVNRARWLIALKMSTEFFTQDVGALSKFTFNYYQDNIISHLLVGNHFEYFNRCEHVFNTWSVRICSVALESSQRCKQKRY